MQEQDDIAREIENLLKGAGLSLVEFSLSRRKGGASVKAVVYSPSGTGTDECVKAHRLMYPRLQVLLGTEDPYIEISSPGIDRVIHSVREYGIFAGKGVRILLVNESEWVKGKILSAVDGKLSLATANGTEVFDLAVVAKARLDSTQEGD